MKKDIDLLGGFNEAKDKKSSSNTSLILMVGVLAIIGVMVFMFVTAKMEIKDKEDLIAGNKQAYEDLKAQNNVDKIKGEIQENDEKYRNLVLEALKEIHSAEIQDHSAEISSKFLDILYKNYCRLKDDDGDEKVHITSLNVDGGKVTLSCEVKDYLEAWDFVHYLCGTLEIERPPFGSTDEEIQAYRDRVDAIRANAIYFEGVPDNYPGLPEEGKGEDYEIMFSLNFTVLWGNMAK